VDFCGGNGIDILDGYRALKAATRWRSWLGHCATSRKVAGSITDGVIRNFPSGRTMDLGSTQAYSRNEYHECFLRSKGGQCVGPTTGPSSCDDCVEILGASTSWNPKGLSRDCCIFFYRALKYLVRKRTVGLQIQTLPDVTQRNFF
jgi:hypothetical protein